MTLVNLGVVAVVTIGLARRDTRDVGGTRRVGHGSPWTPRARAATIASLWLVASVLATTQLEWESHNLEHHPVLALVRSAVATPTAASAIELSEAVRRYRRPGSGRGAP